MAQLRKSISLGVRSGLAKVILFALHAQSTGQECDVMYSVYYSYKQLLVHFNVLLQYQECCVVTCTTLYFGIPEDGVLALKHTGILYVEYDF